MRHLTWIARNGRAGDARAALWRWLESEWTGIFVSVGSRALGF
jgi:hypothetical protein